MYNGIGLLTPRGSGTSGYVQTNKFNLRVSPQLSVDETDRNKAPTHKKPNIQIIEHNRKREIELKVEEMRVLLEDQGYAHSLRQSSGSDGTEVYMHTDWPDVFLVRGCFFASSSSVVPATNLLFC